MPTHDPDPGAFDPRAGDPDRQAELFHDIYLELRTIAGCLVARGRPATMQPTALVHEAWIKLCGAEGKVWNNHEHFLRVAARAMRQILVDHIRRKHSGKRRPPGRRLYLDEVADAVQRHTDGSDCVALHESLERLYALDHEGAQIVDLHFFLGLTVTQCAHNLELSVSTTERRLRAARAWLKRELS
ncbi:MAG TPA: ECF-type sigma factor [Planctomycetota bacterium]|nr:ECF-type sigma factor [Planctomycetota bacterium]